MFFRFGRQFAATGLLRSINMSFPIAATTAANTSNNARTAAAKRRRTGKRRRYGAARFALSLRKKCQKNHMNSCVTDTFNQPKQEKGMRTKIYEAIQKKNTEG
jgi:hypothetical protein